ncbi:MAG TPA: hypothetical protein VFK41_05305 [Nocardioidaceae bacterium]|nr:hypothetical protein [Nocardioidaceae bacterium]
MTEPELSRERAERVVALLESNVLEELQIANLSYSLGLSEQSMENIMQMVTSSILYAFHVEWSPDWVKAGDVHSWEERAGIFARCSVCLQDSPASATREAAADWARRHEQSHAL